MNTKTSRVLITALSAALFYGGWAFFANKDAGNVWLSTAVQFGLSFVFGLTLSLIIEHIFERMSQGNHINKLLRFVFSALIPYWLALVMLALAHWVANTQNILLTLLPNAIIGTLYFVVYVKKLEQLEA